MQNASLRILRLGGDPWDRFVRDQLELSCACLGSVIPEFILSPIDFETLSKRRRHTLFTIEHDRNYFPQPQNMHSALRTDRHMVLTTTLSDSTAKHSDPQALPEFTMQAMPQMMVSYFPVVQLPAHMQPKLCPVQKERPLFRPFF
jgi:hypothetical protein